METWNRKSKYMAENNFSTFKDQHKAVNRQQRQSAKHSLKETPQVCAIQIKHNCLFRKTFVG